MTKPHLQRLYMWIQPDSLSHNTQDTFVRKLGLYLHMEIPVYLDRRG